jgi:vacuolar-type H+-ATPase subunit I/STV1
VIPLFFSKPEPVSKVRVITVKEQLEHTIKTLHKAGIRHIKVSAKLETLDPLALENDLHTTCDPLTHIYNIIICLQTGKHTYLEDNIELIYSRLFTESDISSRFVTVKWN